MEHLMAQILGVLVLVILAVSLFFLLRKGAYHDFKKRLIFKTICSAMFWIFSWIVVWYSKAGLVPSIILMILGFTFSVAGDVFLVFKKDIAFILGLSSFALAHVFYSASFILRYGFDIANAALFAAISIAAILFFNFSKLVSLGKMRLPATFYVLVIAFMFSNALFGLKFAVGSGFLPAVFTLTGAVLFFISDSTLAFEKFSVKGNLCLEKPVHITYFSAQVFLALGMIQIAL